MFCCKCGQTINDDSIFCNYCGASQAEMEEYASDQVEKVGYTEAGVGVDAQEEKNRTRNAVIDPIKNAAYDTMEGVFDKAAHVVGKAVQEKAGEWIDNFLIDTGIKKRTISGTLKKKVGMLQETLAEKLEGKSTKEHTRKK